MKTGSGEPTERTISQRAGTTRKIIVRARGRVVNLKSLTRK